MADYIRTRVNKRELQRVAKLRVGDRITLRGGMTWLGQYTGTIRTIRVQPQVDFLNVEGRTSHDTRVHKGFDIYGQYVIDWDGNVPDNLTRRLCVSGEYIKKLRGKKR